MKRSAENPILKNDLKKSNIDPNNVTYWNYIVPESLVKLQKPVTEHHDEHLFILIHQVFELWFRQIIVELEAVINLFVEIKNGEAQPEALFYIRKYLDRSDLIMRTSMTGFSVMETMDSDDFLRFRDSLGTSSGFQSSQFRQLEQILGVKERAPVFDEHGKVSDIDTVYQQLGCPVFHHEIMEKARSLPSLKTCVFEWLNTMEIENLDGFFDVFMETKTDEKRAQAEEFFSGDNSHALKVALFLNTYHAHPVWSQSYSILDCVVKIEQAFTLWKHRHPRMTEIIIGRRKGTGNSAGVNYLDSTYQFQYRIFPELIFIKSHCVASTRLSGNLSTSGIWNSQPQSS